MRLLLPAPGFPPSSTRSTSRRSLHHSPSRALTIATASSQKPCAPGRRVRPDLHADPRRERGHRPCRHVPNGGRAGRHQRHNQRTALQVRQHALPQAPGLPGSHPQRAGHRDTGAVAARCQRAEDSGFAPRSYESIDDPWATSPCQLVLGAIAVGASSFLTAVTDAEALDAYQNAIRAADAWLGQGNCVPERSSPVRRRTKLTSPVSGGSTGPLAGKMESVYC